MLHFNLVWYQHHLNFGHTKSELRIKAFTVNRVGNELSYMFLSSCLQYLECVTPRARALVTGAVCMDVFFIQGCKLASANHCHAHTVDGLRLGWAGGANVWEAAMDPSRDGGRPNARLCIRLGELQSSTLPPEFCCFIVIMAAAQTEPSQCSCSWQRPSNIYGGLSCNSLMAGKFFLSLLFFSLFEWNQSCWRMICECSLNLG